MVRKLNVLGCGTREIDDAIRIVGKAVIHRHIDRAAIAVVLHLDHGAEGQGVVSGSPALGLINRSGGGVMARVVIRDVGGVATHLIGGLGAACQQGEKGEGKESKKRGIVHDLRHGA